MGFSPITHLFWGTTIYAKPHIPNEVSIRGQHLEPLKHWTPRDIGRIGAILAGDRRLCNETTEMRGYQWVLNTWAMSVILDTKPIFQPLIFVIFVSIWAAPMTDFQDLNWRYPANQGLGRGFCLAHAKDIKERHIKTIISVHEQLYNVWSTWTVQPWFEKHM